MSNELMLDVGQACELKAAFRRESSGESEWTNAKIKALCERRGLLTQVLDVLEGRAEIKPYVVDLDAAPFTPDGWRVLSHKQGGQWKYDATKVVLYESERLSVDWSRDDYPPRVDGIKLYQELESQMVMNANLLDFYLAHPHLIPENWGNRHVFFWGTIYYAGPDESIIPCNFNGVRCLYWKCGEWRSYHRWLDESWGLLEPAVLLGK